MAIAQIEPTLKPYDTYLPPIRFLGKFFSGGWWVQAFLDELTTKYVKCNTIWRAPQLDQVLARQVHLLRGEPTHTNADPSDQNARWINQNSNKRWA